MAGQFRSPQSGRYERTDLTPDATRASFLVATEAFFGAVSSTPSADDTGTATGIDDVSSVAATQTMADTGTATGAEFSSIVIDSWSDAFDDGVVNTDARWSSSYIDATNAPVTESGGAVRIDLPASFASGSAYSGLFSTHPTRLSETTLHAEISGMPVQSNSEGYFGVWQYSGDTAAKLDVLHGTLRFRKRVAGTETSVSTIAYNATDHRYLRFRHTGTTVYWESSPDGTTWSTLESDATGFIDTTRVFVELGSGVFAPGPATPTDFVVEGFNVTPPTPIGAADTGTASGTETPSLATAQTADDTGAATGADAVSSVSAAPIGSDTGSSTGTDGRSLSVDVAASDTGTATGAESPSVGNPVSRSDAGTATGSDAVSSVAPAVVMADTATATGSDAADTGSSTATPSVADTAFPWGLDSASALSIVSASASDTATVVSGGTFGDEVFDDLDFGFETPPVVSPLIATTDSATATGGELVSIDTAKSGSDAGTATGSDDGSVLATRSVADAATATGTDQAIPGSQASVVDTGTATGTESRAVTGAFARDDTASATGSESASLSVQSTATDTGTATGVDNQSVGEVGESPTRDDVGGATGAETTSVTVVASIADAGTSSGVVDRSVLASTTRDDVSVADGEESGAIAAARSVADTGTATGVDAANMSLYPQLSTVSDVGSGIGVDEGSVLSSMPQADTGSATGEEFPSLSVSVGVSDTGLGIGTASVETEVVVLVSVSDTGLATGYTAVSVDVALRAIGTLTHGTPFVVRVVTTGDVRIVRLTGRPFSLVTVTHDDPVLVG